MHILWHVYFGGVIISLFIDCLVTKMLINQPGSFVNSNKKNKALMVMVVTALAWPHFIWFCVSQSFKKTR